MAEPEVVKPAPAYTPPPPLPHVPAIANPVPLGLFAFGTTTFVLSCYNAGIFGIHLSTPPNLVIGMAVFYGGIAQFAAGMWEFRTGNTFGATAFASYGSFWLSYAAILIPWFGVGDSYDAYQRELGSALGIFLLGWALFTFLMWFGTLRTNLALSALFAFLTLTFLLLSIAEFKRASGLRVKRAGGWFGIFTAIIAWYIALAGLLTHENSFFTLPVVPLHKRR